MSNKYNIIEHIPIGFKPFRLKCISICYINYSKKPPKMFISPTLCDIQTCFFFSGLMKLCMSTNQTISSPFTKASVECDAQISNCTHFSYKSWVIPSCLCSKRLVFNVWNVMHKFQIVHIFPINRGLYLHVYAARDWYLT